MKKTNRIVGIGALSLLLGALALSCASTPNKPYLGSREVLKKNYGDPASTTLVYGSVKQISSVFNALGSKDIQSLEMIQLNQKGEPLAITPGRVGSTFYTQPVPVGSSLKIVFFKIQGGNSATLFYRGIQGKGPSDVRVEKPGLLYLGSLLFCSEQYAKTHKLNLADPDADLYPAGDEKEIRALKDMLPHFRGTAWEPIISARIKELAK